MRAFIVILLTSFSAFASAGDRIYTGIFSSTAVGGYDVVSFYSEQGPVEGSKKFQTKYADAKWLFSSKANLEKFTAEPEKYIPQYGGHCAWAVGAKNARAPGDPKYWKLVDGKLYLNYDAKVQEKWLVDVPGFIEKADKNWPSLLND